MPAERGTIVLVIPAQIAPRDVPAICDRLRCALARSNVGEIVCDVGALDNPDLRAVDVLATLQLTARRLGRRMRLRHASSRLMELLALAGLDGVLALRVEAGGQPEEREQRVGVEEEGELDESPG